MRHETHAVVGDVRREEDVQRVVDAAVQRFGGVDVCVNNASAIAVEPTAKLSAKKYDLMQEINLRGTFLLTKACVAHLEKSANPHVLTISPPVNMNPRWLGDHPAYTLSKYGMTLLSLGWAAEFADAGQKQAQAGVAPDPREARAAGAPEASAAKPLRGRGGTSGSGSGPSKRPRAGAPAPSARKPRGGKPPVGQ